jgi:hypothetical protein
MFSLILYSTNNNQTYVQFVNGVYTLSSPIGSGQDLAVEVTDTAISGSETLKVSIDSGTTFITSASAQSISGGVKFVFTGDPFGFVAAGNQSAQVALTQIAYLDSGQDRVVAAGTVDNNELYDIDSNPIGWGTLGISTIKPTAMVQDLYYSTVTSNTVIQFITGTFSDGSVVVGSTKINEKSSVSVILNGVTVSGTLVAGTGGDPGPKLIKSGDVFELVTLESAYSLPVKISTG